MQTLRVVVAAGERVEAVETTVDLVVIAGTEVLHLQVWVELLGAVEHVGGGWAGGVGGKQVLAVSIVVEAGGDRGGV